MDQNILITQYIYTTNPQRGGAFGIVAKSSNFDDETQNEIRYINSCIINRPELDGQTSTSKIEIINETNSKSLKSNDKDFRDNPENAPYRIAKCELIDGRILVVRAAAIGQVYSDIDQRYGNLFVHGIIFPAGTILTNEDISKIDFKIGLPPQKKWDEYKIPETLDNKLRIKNPKEQSSQQNAQKYIFPPALFTSSENIHKWKKERDKLNSSNDYDSITEQDIKELGEKIERAQTYINDFIKNANENKLDELISQCKNKIEILKSKSKLKALSENKKFDLASMCITDEYRALSDLKIKAKNEQERRNIEL